MGSFHTASRSDRTSPARRFLTPRGLPFLPIVLPGLNIQLFSFGHKVGTAEAIAPPASVHEQSQSCLRQCAAFRAVLLDKSLALGSECIKRVVKLFHKGLDSFFKRGNGNFFPCC